MTIALLVILVVAVVCGIAGAIQHEMAIQKLRSSYQALLDSYRLRETAYRELLSTIRHERMLFTRHPKFRDTANTISRLLS